MHTDMPMEEATDGDSQAIGSQFLSFHFRRSSVRLGCPAWFAIKLAEDRLVVQSYNIVHSHSTYPTEFVAHQRRFSSSGTLALTSIKADVFMYTSSLVYGSHDSTTSDVRGGVSIRCLSI